jgi:hypothetical protein
LLIICSCFAFERASVVRFGEVFVVCRIRVRQQALRHEK